MNKQNFHTISKEEIYKFIENHNSDVWESVCNIQNIKEDMIKRISKELWDNNVKFIDPRLINGVEKDYFELLKKSEWDINKDFDYTKQKNEFEKMFKTHEFDEIYIKNFDDIRKSHMIEIPKNKLIKKQKELQNNKNKLGIKDKEEFIRINQIVKLLDNTNIENTKSRNLFFDEKQFNNSWKSFNIQCFFEQDKKWNKNYFSANELLNDLETFGIESGYPIINEMATNNKKEFRNLQKLIKLSLIRNILSKYRDYQEVLMHHLTDYEKRKNGEMLGNKSGILAEKIVEWSFRNLANTDEKYEIKIKKASIGEDQINKIDLIIQIKDKKTGVNIQKELQLTLNEDKNILQHKRIQIERQKNTRHADIDLLELELNLLWQKVTIWRNLDRPIWWLSGVLSLEDKEFLKTTYDRIISELENKI